MKRLGWSCLALAGLVLAAIAAETPPPKTVPAAATRIAGTQFISDTELKRPVGYRDWQYVSSGLGMSYGPVAQQAALMGHVMFDNVFVQPEAYRSFQKNGVWPEGTMFVLELRGTETKRHPNNGGYFQTDLHGLEVSVKDSKRFKDRWAYFEFGDAASATPQPNDGCFACHKANAAVDMTFVQFYPTLQKTAPAPHN